MGTNITQASIHLMIIWSEAMNYKDKIIEDLKLNFKVLNLFSIKWDRNLFMENYTIFYAHSLKELDRFSLEKVLTDKILHCGTDKFTVIIFQDDNPHYSNRQTSSGKRLVNTNVFDKKNLYRKWTGGGHRIHASDDEWETNKDLTLLLGQNIKDYLKNNSFQTISEKTYSQNCIGVNGYNSIQELFYVLNNTIKYVVLRNFDCIPEKYTIEGHGDIDLLVEHKNYITYLTLAKPIFEESYRVYHTININKENIPFDFRHIGDNYYDYFWEEHIINNRQIKKNLFYIPNAEDLFYSLLYHAYIQKLNVKSDYIKKLHELGKNINIQFHSNNQYVISLLDIFMKGRNYEYIKPNDLSVAYNEENIALSTHALRYGKAIKALAIKEDSSLYSKVFENDSSFVKIGTNKLIDNEAYFLNKLSKYRFFPKILKWEKGEHESILETKKVPGIDFLSFFSISSHRKSSYIRSFIKECCEILSILYSSHIIHRDFTPYNLLIEEKEGECNVYLIDFGWAINSINPAEELLLTGLGNGYYISNYYSDFQAVANILKKHFNESQLTIPISNILISINQKEYNCEEFIDYKLNKIRKRLNSISIIDRFYSLKEYYHTFLQNHPTIYNVRIHFYRMFHL